MLDWLGGLFGGLVSGAGSYFGAQQTAQAQRDVNAANIAEQNFLDTHHIQDVVSDARAAGINPLAAMGSSTPSAPVQVGTDVGKGLADASQDVGRAISALSSRDDKTAQLNQELLQAKIDNTRADTVQTMANASRSGRVFASPGTSPGIGDTGGRFVMQKDRPMPSMWQDYDDGMGGTIRLLSRPASESVMNAASLPAALPIGVGMISQNVGNWLHGLRGDVFRNLTPQSLPSWPAPSSENVP